MLQLRPNCESCNDNLAVDSAAYICTFECTFCEGCSVNLHKHLCPNCRGNLVKRPIRPKELLDKYPPSSKRVTN